MIQKDSFVVTSKGNYGKVISVGKTTAQVKIGFKTHEIDLYNLVDITDGTHLSVHYIDEAGEKGNTLVFVKHLTCIYDASNPINELIPKLAHLVEQKTNKRVIIQKVLIP